MSSDPNADGEAPDVDTTPRVDAVDTSFSVDAVPAVLRDHDQWVCWRTEDRDGDPTKLPVDPTTGSYASASDSDTWTSFDQAHSYHADPDTDTDGVGFVFTADNTVAGVDLDKCRNPDTGQPTDTAQDVIDRLDSYAEVSPSGTGYHVYVHGFIPDGRNRRDGVEMYDDARFFTVTGEHVDGTPATVEQRADALRAVHGDYVAPDDSDSTEDRNMPTAAGGGDITLDDDALISKAKAADNGDKFTRLWNGDAAGYQSHSEADLALVDLLAFWTGGDRARIDRLFRRSGLCRDKWTDREDYRRRTIDTALDGRSDFYDPDRGNADDVATALPDTPTRPDNDTVADANPDGSDPTADRGDGMDVTLCPAEVIAWAGLGGDDDLSALNDREKAACVWELLKHSDRYHIRVRRDNGSLWAYDNGIWTPTGERALRHAGRQALGAMNYGSSVLGELKAQARGDPTIEVDADDLGLDPGYLAVENGLIDLDSATNGAGNDALRDLRPDDYALTRLAVEYDPTADYDEWAVYVEEWAEDGRADALQEYIGYCLHVGEMPIHRALLLVGTGANGKGTFLSVVRALLGRENTSSIELQTLANERDALADFYGSLANIDDDLSARKLGQGLGIFKKLVGGDRVRARRLYQDGFEFDATGKHLYAANEVPDVNVPDDDEAFWRRWLLVEFPNHYPPNQRDPEIRDRLTEPNALSGVLNWAIDGWARLLDQGYFTGEKQYAQAKRERWQAWGDSVDKFISECIERDPDAENVSTGDVHRVYAAWCRENGERPASQQKLTAELKSENLDYAKSVRPGGTGTPTRGYKRLGFTDDAPDLNDTPERGSGQQRLG
jgi:putative DNA primase/helicase